MEKEMLEQPEVLASNSGRYASELKDALQGVDFDMVLIAARGSSDHAGLFARYLFEINLGVPVCLAAPSVITKFGSKLKYPKTLAIGISQSGAAPDVAGVMEAMRDAGHYTLGITNTPDSRLTHASEKSLILETGDENSIAATKTYTASLLAMYEVVRACGADLDPTTGLLPDAAWMEKTREAAGENLGPILRCSPVFSLGRGYSYCTAYETALKMIECALIPCKAYSTADFAHGPKALAAHRSAAIVFSDLPEDLEATGCSVINAPAGTDGPLRPIWQIIFGQWMALLSARARGLDPDHAQNLKKVTETL